MHFDFCPVAFAAGRFFLGRGAVRGVVMTRSSNREIATRVSASIANGAIPSSNTAMFHEQIQALPPL